MGLKYRIRSNKTQALVKGRWRVWSRYLKKRKVEARQIIVYGNIVDGDEYSSIRSESYIYVDRSVTPEMVKKELLKHGDRFVGFGKQKYKIAGRDVIVNKNKVKSLESAVKGLIDGASWTKGTKHHSSKSKIELNLTEREKFMQAWRSKE